MYFYLMSNKDIYYLFIIIIPSEALRSDFIILSRAKRARSLLTTRGLSQQRNSRLHK